MKCSIRDSALLCSSGWLGAAFVAQVILKPISCLPSAEMSDGQHYAWLT